MIGAPVFDHPDRFDPAPHPPGRHHRHGAERPDLPRRRWHSRVAQPGRQRLERAGGHPGTAAGRAFHDIQIADLFGRGTPCLVWSSRLPGETEPPLRYVDLMGGRKPHLMTRYLNNMGKETGLEYRASTDRLPARPGRRPRVGDAAAVSCPGRRPGRRSSSTSAARRRVSKLHLPPRLLGSGRARVPRLRAGRPSGQRGLRNLVRDHAGRPARRRAEQFQAPMLTRTWYHVGAFEDRTGC